MGVILSANECCEWSTVRLPGTAPSADLGGSSNDSNGNFED